MWIYLVEFFMCSGEGLNLFFYLKKLPIVSTIVTIRIKLGIYSFILRNSI